MTMLVMITVSITQFHEPLALLKPQTQKGIPPHSYTGSTLPRRVLDRNPVLLTGLPYKPQGSRSWPKIDWY